MTMYILQEKTQRFSFNIGYQVIKIKCSVQRNEDPGQITRVSNFGRRMPSPHDLLWVPACLSVRADFPAVFRSVVPLTFSTVKWKSLHTIQHVTSILGDINVFLLYPNEDDVEAVRNCCE